MGVQACPLPTAVLSAQTDYPSFFYEDLTSNMPHFKEEWRKLNVTFDGIHTGFVTGKEQIDHIFSFLDTFYKDETLLLVDPVMGDRGEAYKIFTDELLARMKELVKCADVITPNITECCLLTGLSYEKLHAYSTEEGFMKALEAAGHMLQQETGARVIITGVTPPSRDADKLVIGNMYLEGEETFYSAMPYNGKNFSGTGDLFASVIMGSMMRGDNLKKAIQLGAEFLTAAIHDASLEEIPEVEGVHFEKYLGMLLEK
jgi:pyridoxine kinase